ncbi:cytochrome o ubiquinol oxidase subunit III [Enterobacter asburiae]|uniref:Cytochrome o ubiquinol oxidase subunit III n=1 Tax=Enterobacter asburiae TaxID=61645 RepID=A0A376F3V3_ENTAS|nr:cytochrome o ubiquinol oxidase subunit III [Enterobacter asburiae]
MNCRSFWFETALLLFSSITYGMAAIAMYKNNKSQVVSWLALTWLFGAGFIGMEIYEFHHLILEGFGPDRSGFLSAFFALVGYPRSARDLWSDLDGGTDVPGIPSRPDQH